MIKNIQKKKFYLKIFVGKYISIRYQLLFHLNLREFEIVYNYNYKPVTFKELTLNYSFNDKEKPKAEELNYEFANYIELEEEEYNQFFYINSEKRNRFIIYLIDGLRRIPYIEICGPIGCGKTVTLLKFINCKIRRSYYINLLTFNCFGIEELKKVLKYEYVKIIGKNYSEENEKDEIISYIQKLNSSKEIFDFILI